MFQFSFIPGYLDYTAVFDEYAIIQTTLRVTPLTVDTTTGDVIGSLVTAIDYDDANAPTGLTQLREYSTACDTRANIGHVRVIYPRLSEASYSGAFTSYTTTRSWLDMASPAVQHYGLKIGIGANPRAITFKIEVTYIFCTRSNR